MAAIRGPATLVNALIAVVGAGDIKRIYASSTFDANDMSLTLRIDVSAEQLAEAAVLLNNTQFTPTRKAKESTNV